MSAALTWCGSYRGAGLLARRPRNRPRTAFSLRAHFQPTHPYPVPFASLLLCVRHWFENQTAQSSAQRRLAALVSAAQEDRPTFKPPHRPPLASRLSPKASPLSPPLRIQQHRRVVRHVHPNVHMRITTEMPHETRALKPPVVPHPILTRILVGVKSQMQLIKPTLRV